MPSISKPPGNRRADQARPAQNQRTHRRDSLKKVLGAALVSGSSASIASAVVVTIFSTIRRGAPAAGTNTASQWIWGEEAKRQETMSVKHTLTGYAIHHASALLWATCFEAWIAKSRHTAGVAAKAAATTAAAYIVDYKVVPARLSPGFERKVGKLGLIAVYTAFASGLFAAHYLRNSQVRLKAKLPGEVA
jgi:hypothetical protein